MKTVFGISFKCRRFPPAIVAHAVWLYLQFNLSLQEREQMLLECGIDVSYETIRRWTVEFAPQSCETCGVGNVALGKSGIWTKSRLKPRADSSGSAAPSISMVPC